MNNDDPQSQTMPAETMPATTGKVDNLSAPNLPLAEQANPKKQPPEITGISAITYPCGCEAKDPEGNLPATCAKHPDFKPEKPVITNRHGQVFDAEIHASQSDGSPATDSQGKFIRKGDHYAPPAQNFFGSR